MQDSETAEPTPFDERIAANKAVSVPEPKQARIDIPIGPDGLQLTSYAQVARLAYLIHKAGLAPSGFRTPEQLMVGLLRALELKLPPFQALESMSVISNRVGLMTNLKLSMVESSGLLEKKRVKHTGTGDELTCTVTLTRRGREAQNYSFSVKQAKIAGIYERSTAWKGYPERMTYNRAMGFALDDEFSDIIKGIKSVEELQDYPVTDNGVRFEKPEKKNSVPAEPINDEL